ncbi:Probable cobalt-precorrin-6Y C(15)-methyltransferase [decarboxylating] [uncultured Blautia sp.]|uniref:precorrin-6A reductase n=1 Tax=Blautia TaxID=572511 RepID=UPI00082059C3|nr:MULTISPECIES: precorrin-6A reductase [Blautia]MCU6775467.1 precorrin-6A reductase [Blautia acetigignens]NSL03549.1 precorrin-6A reductase [Blautia glucerasea]SCH79602.1 Probable cobalt-precorrin-6Y C(15)-methyltransferase [decarboxylating] [uncultured Blautia sp.]
MSEIIVFAGTTEGCDISNFLAEHQIHVLACVATDYGSKSLKENEYLKIHAGRLTEPEMEALLNEKKPEMVLDATHPYAAEVTENIRTACQNTGLEYRRVLREAGAYQDQAVYVPDTQAAIEFLEGTEGNILLTTGSKELGKYTALSDAGERIYARVLSLPSVMETCKGYGFEGKHLIGMQGPFSMELNAAMLRQFDCKYLVTKDTGKAGGFQEKIDAALSCGTVPVIIGRPLKEEGLSVAECRHMLAEYFGFTVKPHITLLGIGMGSQETLTVQGKKAAKSADLIIGAKRMADAVREPRQAVVYEYRSDVIADYIRNHPEYEKVVIALSGDVGFYSGARKLLTALGGRESNVEVICGISSVVYFMSEIGLSWDDAKITSAHGKHCNLISMIRHNQKVFSILGTGTAVAELAGKLVKYHMGEVRLYVGENLSYPDEKIFVKKAEELTNYEGQPLSVVCAFHENPEPALSTHGIPDEEFIRGKAPMTKEEVRSVSLSKLRLTEDSICYDVGAGTGSVSVEMALRADQGQVFAIEKKEEAAALLEENKQKFAVDNLEIIKGEAPQALENLPAPTHAFIGGSSGNLKEIVALLLGKNPQVRIVINCITLETISEALDVLKEYGFQQREVVQLAASRSKEIGRYHLMMGENPIYIITCQNPKMRK